MKITFSIDSDSQSIIESEFEDFQNNVVGVTLPNDYRDHMVNVCNGGIPNGNFYHLNYPEGGGKIRYLYPIKYGSITMESIFNAINNEIPQGYLAIGSTSGGGEIIMSLNTDNYGFIK